MHLIMYSSNYTGTDQSAVGDIANILESARINNPKHDITGMLFFDDGKFIQVLEGEKTVIHELLEQIKKDKRHNHVELLMDQEIAARELTDWNMRAFNISSVKNKDWSLLREFRNIYLENFKASATQIINLLQKFIEDSSVFERFRS